MLGKLIKHELKATSRWFLPIYALVILLTPLERFIFTQMDHISLEEPFSSMGAILIFFITLAYALSMAATCMGSFFLIIYRFYKNMATSEGYLMHTLPVKTHQLIWSKAIVGFLWNMASLLVIFLSIFLLAVGMEGWDSFIAEISYGLGVFFQQYGADLNLWILFLQLIFMAIIGYLFSIFLMYASIAIGQIFTKHKLLGSFGAFFLLNIMTQILTVLGSATFFRGIERSHVMPAITYPEVLSAFNLLLAVTLLGYAAISAGLYFITWYLFKNRLNLE